MLKRFIYILFVGMFLLITFPSCSATKEKSSAQGNPLPDKLTALSFAAAITDNKSAVVLDVRTPGEFTEGHIAGAVNIDWNGSSFKEQVKKIDTSTVLLVYCLSGGRSNAAAGYLRSQGFAHVHELEGGIMAWRAAGLPQESGVQANAETKVLTLDSLLATNEVVLLDFYAEWCGPCKKLEPILEEISKEYQGKVRVIRIDVDQQQKLAEELKIESIPTLMVYKSGKRTWLHIGFADKALITQQLK